MFAGVRVLRGVFVWRVVAAAGRAAFLASAQVDPLRTDLHAFFTLVVLWLLYRSDRANVMTGSVHHGFFLLRRVRDYYRRCGPTKFRFSETNGRSFISARSAIRLEWSPSYVSNL